MHTGLKYLIKSYRPLKGTAALWVYAALAIGIASMVLLFRFSARVEATVNKDARKFLAADFQVQARRHPTPDVYAAATEIAGGAKDHLALQTDLLSSVQMPGGEPLTVSLRAIENDAYPFYGTFKLAPQLPVSALQKHTNGRYGIFVDASMRERGLKLGDEIVVGSIKAVVMAYIEEEPQSVASAFALGPRFIVHQTALTDSKLTDFGAYAFYSLLIKSSLKLTVAQRIFKSHVSDPHWRIVSPERANQQTERVVSRLQSFLMLIAFAAFVLGGVGLFAIARFQILRNLSDWILFKALGLTRADLIKFSLYWISLVAGVALNLGFTLGALLENALSDYARHVMAVDLASISVWTALPHAVVLAFGASMFALGLPLLQVISVSPNQAWSTSKFKSIDANGKTEWLIFIAGSLLIGALAMTGVIAKSWVVAILWAGATWIGAACVRSLAKRFGERRESVLAKYPYLWVHRSWSELRVLNYSIAAAIYLMVLVAVIATTMRRQLSIGRTDAAPQAVAIGVLQDQKDAMQLPVGVSTKWVPTLQMRITSVKGEAVKMAEYDDQGESKEDEQRSSFSFTREYIVSARSALDDNETLVKSAEPRALFTKGVIEGGGVRLSLERSFAKRLDVDVGDKLTVSIAGVDLPARVDSLRTVQWFRFQPSFFVVVNPEDLAGAPYNYVGLFGAVNNLRELQKSLQSQYSNVAVIDSRSIADRLITLIDRVVMAISSLGIFVLIAAAWVFVAVLISRRPAFRQDLYLLRLLGSSAGGLRRLAMTHFAFLTISTSLVSSFLAVLSSWVVCHWMLDISLAWTTSFYAMLGAVAVSLVFTGLGFWLSGPYAKWDNEAKDFAWQPG